MESHINTMSISSLGRPLKPAIMQRIDRLAKINARRVLALARRDRDELLRVAAEYAQMRYMQNTARQVMREAEGL